MDRTIDVKLYTLLARVNKLLEGAENQDDVYGVYYKPIADDIAQNTVTLHFVGLTETTKNVDISVNFDINRADSTPTLLAKIADGLDKLLSAESGAGEVRVHAIEYLYDVFASFEFLNEDKQEICNALCKALQATRGAYDLVALKYEEDAERGIEIVEAEFAGGSKRINVSLDSGTAMIRDIVTNIGC